MADFVASVPDQEIRRRLERAIEGRGAFRRFEDELLDHPDLREAWFALADARIAAGEFPAQAISRARTTPRSTRRRRPSPSWVRRGRGTRASLPRSASR